MFVIIPGFFSPGVFVFIEFGISVYKYMRPHLALLELRESKRSLGVVEATTLCPLGFGRQAESRKICSDHLKMNLALDLSKHVSLP
jgi:hypothetical protein